MLAKKFNTTTVLQCHNRITAKIVEKSLPQIKNLSMDSLLTESKMNFSLKTKVIDHSYEINSDCIT